MAWNPIEVYYQHALSGLVATTQDANYPAANLLDRIDGTLYKATSTATLNITFDAGSGNTYTADYLLIAVHNLFTAGATVVLQYSTDNFSSDINDAFTAFAPSDNKLILKKFTSQVKRYWRIRITGASAIPFMAIAQWGVRTVWDYASGMLDPEADDIKGNVNVSELGYVQGIRERYIERQMQFTFNDIDDTLYQKLKAWRDAVGLRMFAAAWDPGDHSSAVYLMRNAETKFSAPMTAESGGAYRDCTIKLIGRKEA